VAGRSNAGKSSAINVIVNRRQFARTSKTPGRTQLVNFFSLRDSERLVDLPGYGFARVSDKKRRHWGGLLSDYFRIRESLRGLIMVVDIRRQLTDYDRRMMEFAELVDLPIHILLTKADKLKRGQAATAVLERPCSHSRPSSTMAKMRPGRCWSASSPCRSAACSATDVRAGPSPRPVDRTDMQAATGYLLARCSLRSLYASQTSTPIPACAPSE
jgi:ribosome biogenesis GTP-binding protein YsxC/EngB